MRQFFDTPTMLFRHHSWANLRLLAFCAFLTREQWAVSLLGGYGSLQETWQHIVLAEQSYFSRISTGQPLGRRSDAPDLTQMEMAESLTRTDAGLIEWASRVQPHDSVAIDWDGMERNVPKTLLLTQAINHATEHRAQIMALLTQLNQEPPELDGWAFFDEYSAREGA